MLYVLNQHQPMDYVICIQSLVVHRLLLVIYVSICLCLKHMFCVITYLYPALSQDIDKIVYRICKI